MRIIILSKKCDSLYNIISITLPIGLNETNTAEINIEKSYFINSQINFNDTYITLYRYN